MKIFLHSIIRNRLSSLIIILYCNILYQCSSFTYTVKNGNPILLGNNGKEICEVKHSQRIWSAFYGILPIGEKSLQNVTFQENHIYQFKEKYSLTEVMGTLILGLWTSITVKTLEIEDCGILKQKEEIKQLESNEG